jgi:hypothetical protein
MGSANFKNIGIGIVVLVIIAGAYIFLVNRNSTDQSLLTQNSSTGTPTQSFPADSTFSASDADVQGVLTILNQLKAVSIDETIFSNPAFIALTDYHRDIAPQPKGRSNPFLPGEGVKTASPSTPGVSGR